MQVLLAYISPRRELKSGGAQMLVQEYLKRCQRFAPVGLEAFRTEAAFWDRMERRTGRAPCLVLLDSGGRTLTSPQIAAYVQEQRDGGVSELILAIGPPDGWAVAASQKAQLRLSLGAITLPHELALAVLSEQVYRALTILAGHPYHAGHE